MTEPRPSLAVYDPVPDLGLAAGAALSPEPADPVLEVSGLSYRYPGAAEPVLRGLDFAIAPGEIFGFLGPNGSGKSTTQKLLTRLLHGHGGAVRVFGRPLAAHGTDYFESIGVSFEFPNLYGKLTAEENLDLYAGFFSGPCRDAYELLARLDLPQGDRRRVGQYSKGMKMRLVLARSLLNRPRLWFLDEPTTGQDPEHAVRVRELIREQAAQGVTVFLTTHDMAVADALCHRVAFLVDGEIAAVDSPRALKLRHTDHRVRVETRRGGVLEQRDFGLDDEADKRAFLDWVTRNDAIETIHTLEPTLEDVFLEVTGRGLRP